MGKKQVFGVAPAGFEGGAAMGGADEADDDALGGGPWYAVTDKVVPQQLSKQDKAAARARCDGVFEKSVAAFEKAKAKHETGDDRYMKQVLKSGTLTDKVAAMTLLVQESPMHRLGTLDELLKLAKSGKHTSKQAMESLRELFGGGVLLPDRRLRTIEESPADVRQDAVLAACRFEEHVARRYADLVDNLVAGYLRHADGKLRVFALESAAALLAAKPEKEAELLAMLVNKLGDPDKAVSSRCVRLLADLLRKHRAMTAVVAAEVQAFATRANLQPKALYTAISFLNQMYLSRDLADLAARLCSMYVALFTATVDASKKDLHTKLLAALLTGLNRALPYCAAPPATSSKKGDIVDVDALYKIAHDGAFSTRVQALALVERILAAKGDAAQQARFYRSLYALLDSKDLRNAQRPTLFMNLLFKSLANDPETNRAAACLKRACQASLHMAPQVAAATLYLAAKVFERKPELKAMILDSPPVVATDDRSTWRDALKREPLATGASQSLWESVVLRSHYHPSVRAFAESLNSKGTIEYKSDPLVDLALSAFLDRFAYRNPKQRPKAQAHAKKASTPVGAGGIPSLVVAAESFLAVPEQHVAPEDAFYHRFFQAQQAVKNATIAKKVADAAADDDDAEDYDNDAFAAEFEDGSSDGGGGTGGGAPDEFDEPDDSDDDSDDAAAAFDKSGDEDDDGGDDDDDDDDDDYDAADDGDGDDGDDDDDDEDDDDDIGALTRGDRAPVKMPGVGSREPAAKKGAAAKKQPSSKKRERASPFQDADAFFAQLEAKQQQTKKPKKTRA